MRNTPDRSKPSAASMTTPASTTWGRSRFDTKPSPVLIKTSAKITKAQPAISRIQNMVLTFCFHPISRNALASGSGVVCASDPDASAFRLIGQIIF